MTDPYENLANAIVASAAKEYMSVLKILKKSPTNENAKKTMTDCERFFRSFWYAALTNVDCEFLIQKLREEALKNDPKGIFKTGLPPERENQLPY